MADPRITWRLGVDDNVSRALKGIDAQIAGVTKAFRTLGGFAGFAAITAGLGRLVSEVTTLASELQDASDKLGVSAEALQRLKGAGEATGASFESIQSALVFLAKTTGEATRGGKEAAEAFRLLGIDAGKLSELPLDRRLSVIAAQLKQLPAGADRADLAVKVLGRGAADLLPLLGNLDEELAKVNVTLTDGQVKALDDATDRWEAFKRDAIVGTGQAMGNLLLMFDEFQKRASKSVVVQPGGGFTIEDTATLGKRTPTSGPTTRGRYKPLSADETAAIIGLPGMKDAKAAIENLRKITEEADAILAKNEKDTYHTSLQGTRSIQALADAQAAWNDELERAAAVTESTKQPFDRYVEQVTEIDRLLREGLISEQVAGQARKNALDELANTADKSAAVVSDKTDAILRDIKSATQGFASDITDVFFDTTQSIGEMFANLAEQIAKIFLQQALIQPALDAIFGAFGGLGGPQEFYPTVTRRAAGGPVSSGTPYFVGEQGPELFVPRGSGTILPNGMGAGGVSIAFNLSSPDPRQAAAVIAANERTIIGIVNKAMQRAGRQPSLAS